MEVDCYLIIELLAYPSNPRCGSRFGVENADGSAFYTGCGILNVNFHPRFLRQQQSLDGEIRVTREIKL